MPRTVMHPTPPTVRLPDRPPSSRPRTSFYLAVGCLSLIAGLVLGVGGFFGVRTLQGEGSTPTGSEGTGGSTSAPAEPTVLEETPRGRDAAVPLGSTFPLASTSLDGEVEVTLAGVNWDADDEIAEANSFNDPPAEGRKLILISVEGVYHGDGFEPYKALNWTRVVYIAADGTEHRRAFRVTPGHDELIGQQGVAEDGSFVDEFSFEVPADLEPGGHVVFSDGSVDLGEASWVRAA